jgi:hypothetical protein
MVNPINEGERKLDWKKGSYPPRYAGNNFYAQIRVTAGRKDPRMETIVTKSKPCTELPVSSLCSALLKGLYGLIHPALIAAFCVISMPLNH